MKTFLLLAVSAALSWLAGVRLATAAPGTVHMSVTPPGSISLCETVTVSFAIAGYTDAAEVDGFNFRLNYNPARFTLVPGSLFMGSLPPLEQNWLSLPPQEPGGNLSDFTVSSVPGVIDLSVVDLRIPPEPLNPRGTAANSGFLYSFKLLATSTGAGGISLAPAAGGVVLHDAFLAPAGVPLFDLASLNVTIVGPELAITRAAGPGNLVTLTWPKGVLQSTDTLGALWTPVPGATNSLTVPVTGARRFYRAVIP